jgi:hypothetical protein
VIETVEKYRCPLCLEEYASREEARRCKAKGIPEPKLRIGQRTGYGTEDRLASRWCYREDEGEVRGGCVVLMEKGGHA